MTNTDPLSFSDSLQMLCSSSTLVVVDSIYNPKVGGECYIDGADKTKHIQQQHARALIWST